MSRPAPAPSAGSETATLDRRSSYALFAGIALVWGVHWVVTKVGLRDMPPFTYATLRVAGGFLTVAAILAWRRELRRPPAGDLPIIASVGLGQVAVSIAIMNLALQVVAAGRSSVLVFTMPLWVALMMAAVLRVRLKRYELVGLLLGLAGIGTLLNPAAIDWSSSGQLAGSAALLVSAVVWAATTIHVRHHRWQSTPLALMPWQLALGLVPLAITALVLEPGLPVRWQPSTVLILLYSGPLATGFAYWGSQVIARALGPLAMTTGLLTVPVVGLVSGALLLSEPVTILDLAGFALTIAGVAVATGSSTAGFRAPAAVEVTAP